MDQSLYWYPDYLNELCECVCVYQKYINKYICIGRWIALWEIWVPLGMLIIDYHGDHCLKVLMCKFTKCVWNECMHTCVCERVCFNS